jgi:SOS-response transcriptional repressor LexA
MKHARPQRYIGATAQDRELHPLSKPEVVLLVFVQAYRDSTLSSPTLRECAEALGVKHSAQVHRLVRRLQAHEALQLATCDRRRSLALTRRFDRIIRRFRERLESFGKAG